MLRPTGALLALATGCALPATVGAPLPATTVGKGNIGTAFHGEMPVLNVVADTKPASKDYQEQLNTPTLRAEASLGVTDSTDLEAEVDFFSLVAPTGASIGVRQHVLGTDAIDLALAGRGGAISNLTKTDTGPCNLGLDLPPPLAASAWFGSAQVTGEAHGGSVRPLLALSATEFRITRDVLLPNTRTAVTTRYWGFAPSATLAVWLVRERIQLAPYVALTRFSSDTFAGGWLVTGGLSVAFRRDR
jgi:hypothetical protein